MMSLRFYETLEILSGTVGVSEVDGMDLVYGNCVFREGWWVGPRIRLLVCRLCLYVSSLVSVDIRAHKHTNYRISGFD